MRYGSASWHYSWGEEVSHVRCQHAPQTFADAPECLERFPLYCATDNHNEKTILERHRR
jgi:hypothetical protein